jgi:hypothetical protein
MPEPIEGVYERLVDRELRLIIDALRDLEAEERDLAVAEAPDRLASFLAGLVGKELRALPDLDQQIALVNALVEQLPSGPHHALPTPARLLTRLRRPLLPGEQAPAHPLIPLVQSDLLVNARDEPRLGEALPRELLTADRVDLLIAFIRWTGLRILLEPLEQLSRRGVPLRVLTTTYLGATERRTGSWNSVPR